MQFIASLLLLLLLHKVSVSYTPSLQKCFYKKRSFFDGFTLGTSISTSIWIAVWRADVTDFRIDVDSEVREKHLWLWRCWNLIWSVQATTSMLVHLSQLAYTPTIWYRISVSVESVQCWCYREIAWFGALLSSADIVSASSIKQIYSLPTKFRPYSKYIFFKYMLCLP